MQNNQPQPNQKPNQTIWIILAVVVLAVAAYGIWTALSNDNGNTNTNNTNAIVNQNANLDRNTNSTTNNNISINANTNKDTNTNSSVIDISDWLTYTNEEFGFEFKYPADWELNEVNNEYGQIVTLQSPESKALLEEGKIDQGYSFNVVFSYWSSINNEYACGGSWIGQKEYSDLADYFTDGNSPKKKVGETAVDGLKAYEVSVAGDGLNYGVMIEHDGIYEIDFERAWDKSQLGTLDEEVLSSIKFTK